MKKIVILLIFILFLTSCDKGLSPDITLEDQIEYLSIDVNKENEERTLVPRGCALTLDEVEQIVLSYKIKISEELLSKDTLEVSVTDILIANSDLYSHLVEVYIMGEKGKAEIELEDDLITITVVVELLEPIDLEEATLNGWDIELVNVLDSEQACKDVRGKVISFKLVLEVVSQDISEE